MSGEMGYFIPYRYAAGTAPCDYPAIAPAFSAGSARFRCFLEVIQSHAADFARFGGEPPEPRFEQDWFPRLDAAAAYAMVRQSFGLRRIVEVGLRAFDPLHGARAQRRQLRHGHTASIRRPRARWRAWRWSTSRRPWTV